ncbi:uncharacterized protein LOC117180841 [Belonocnema kinseyi]|uniref:uncharacterized protein LOC117180841 n=1 Tax=Belonocnema kinseyi TaxID=2817044 RepID=UPI00143D7F29|nr:uncharacterized protein LOC117180841 [Belonocnema kinseyi]
MQIKLLGKLKTSCGYHFKSHKIFLQSKRGSYNGHCKCSGSIIGEVKDLDKEVITATCTLTKGTKPCGKRYLRNPQRMKMAQKLYEENICSSVYRAKQADELMAEEDPESGLLYSTKVLQNAKNEYVKSVCLHKNPMTALAIQVGKLKNILRFLAQNPLIIFM